MCDMCANFEPDPIKAVRTAATQTLVVLVGTQFALLRFVSNSNHALAKNFGTLKSSPILKTKIATEFHKWSCTIPVLERNSDFRRKSIKNGVSDKNLQEVRISQPINTKF